jgi:cytochrome c oxidase cbb3-type subunit 2
MPTYAWLADHQVDSSLTPDKLRLMRKLGVPYTDEDIAQASAAVTGKSEMDALIAYLQGLGLASKEWH